MTNEVYIRRVLGKCVKTSNQMSKWLENNKDVELFRIIQITKSATCLASLTEVATECSYNEIPELSLLGVLPENILRRFVGSFNSSDISDYFVWNYVIPDTIVELRDKHVLNKMKNKLNKIEDSRTCELFNRIYNCTRELLELDTSYLEDFDLMKLHLINIICSTWDLWEIVNPSDTEPKGFRGAISYLFRRIDKPDLFALDRMNFVQSAEYLSNAIRSSQYKPYELIRLKDPDAFTFGIYDFKNSMSLDCKHYAAMIKADLGGEVAMIYSKGFNKQTGESIGVVGFEILNNDSKKELVYCSYGHHFVNVINDKVYDIKHNIFGVSMKSYINMLDTLNGNDYIIDYDIPDDFKKLFKDVKDIVGEDLQNHKDLEYNYSLVELFEELYK